MMPREGDRERRRERAGKSASVDAILQAAALEFEQKGLDGSRIESIARAAGISKQMVYHYFESKDALYSELAKIVAVRCYSALLNTDYWALEPLAAIAAYVENAFDQYCENPLLAAMTEDQGLHKAQQLRSHPEIENLRRRLSTQIEDALARGKKSGAIRSDVSFDRLDFITATLISKCVWLPGGYAEGIAGETDPMSQEEWREFAVAFISAGVCVPRR